MPVISELVHGARSFWLKNDRVELFLTETGGHLGPVAFKLKHRWVRPYSLPPWTATEVSKDVQPIIKIARGDFFCLPFGESRGIPYVHGDTANLDWRPVEVDFNQLVLEMEMKTIKGKVRKIITLNPGHRAVYQEHLVQGLQGRYNYGNHAIIEFPEKGGPFHINTSPFRFGQVKPDAFSNPAIGEYSALKTGARFDSLESVPLADGGKTSLSRYPARPGFEDLVMVTSDSEKLAWTAVTLDGYIWFSLKDPRVLPSTLFWISNGGRHSEPWNGRHRNRIGLEEVNSHFCDGLQQSRRNLLADQNISTTGHFSARKPKSIRIVQAVHPVPRGFGKVVAIAPDAAGVAVTVTGSSRRKVVVPVNWRFLETD